MRMISITHPTAETATQGVNHGGSTTIASTVSVTCHDTEDLPSTTTALRTKWRRAATSQAVGLASPSNRQRSYSPNSVECRASNSNTRQRNTTIGTEINRWRGTMFLTAVKPVTRKGTRLDMEDTLAVTTETVFLQSTTTATEAQETTQLFSQTLKHAAWMPVTCTSSCPAQKTFCGIIAVTFSPKITKMLTETLKHMRQLWTSTKTA